MSDSLVFIVEENQEDRDRLIQILNRRSLPCRTFQSGEQFLEDFSHERTSCVISPLQSSGMGGIRIQEVLKSRGHRVPTILTFDEPNLRTALEAMRDGEFTLLQRPIVEDDVWKSVISAIQKDETLRAQELRTEIERRKLSRLSPDEERVLLGIMQGKANKLIASELDVSIRTIESRRHNIFKKTETESVAELVQCVMLVRGPVIDFDQRSTN